MEALNDAALSKNYNPHEIRLFTENKISSTINGDIAKNIDSEELQPSIRPINLSAIIGVLPPNKRDNLWLFSTTTTSALESNMQHAHILGKPPILYFGTPVILVSTINEDGTANLAPMSSAWWLG
ncbi:hypothetical protein [Methylovulum miyakonense]|uniref:hypothetical protein n=1 Tax=Methylovulum miyakonense TaxID=645578 RepID=UPI0018DEA076|nr:hypothetical protein [Methylovulum miyakonense]